MSLTCACHNLRRASRVVTQLFDDHFDAVGLKATQFTALAALAWHEEQAPTVGELASTLVLEQSSLSRNLAVLERQRLIRLVPGEDDRRERRVVLTRTGRVALERGYPVWRKAQAALAEALGDEELETQLRALRELATKAQQIRPSPRAARAARRSA